MASGERKQSEDFKEYRERLKREQKEARDKLAGRLVWFSSYINGEGKNVKVNGTYVKKREDS